MKVEQVSYDINWKKFKRGTSIFVPCLDSSKAKMQVARVLKRFKIKHLMRVEIKDGIKGLRVWHL